MWKEVTFAFMEHNSEMKIHGEVQNVSMLQGVGLTHFIKNVAGLHESSGRKQKMYHSKLITGINT